MALLGKLCVLKKYLHSKIVSIVVFSIVNMNILVKAAKTHWLALS